jgi:dihydrofolate reductase
VRLVATEYLSLDGVFEEPGKWSFPFFNEEAGQFKWAELRASNALLLGRTTYEGLRPPFHEGANVSLKHLFGGISDNEVISIPDPIHLVALALGKVSET